jgi:hypothetical protein
MTHFLGRCSGAIASPMAMGDWLEAPLREPWRAIFIGWLLLFASTTLLAWRLWPRRQPMAAWCRRHIPSGSSPEA